MSNSSVEAFNYFRSIDYIIGARNDVELVEKFLNLTEINRRDILVWFYHSPNSIRLTVRNKWDLKEDYIFTWESATKWRIQTLDYYLEELEKESRLMKESTINE